MTCFTRDPTVEALDGPSTLVDAVRDARRRTMTSVEDFDEAALLGPRLSIVNPPLWEIGHVAWFQERWVLRHACGHPPRRTDGDALYDSAKVAHATRWFLPLPGLKETLRDLADVRDRVIERIEAAPDDPTLRYFVLLSVFHEDMHVEAFMWTRQTLGYPSLPGTYAPPVEPAIDEALGDTEVEGGTFMLGARPTDSFVFDNEKWAHSVEIAPFRIARTAVTQAEFAGFVDDGGYHDARYWSPEGWAWRTEQQAEYPVYWRKDGPAWSRREFDRWVALEPDLPVMHVSSHEADAFCRWAGRRLPTEAEWELAASGPAEDPDAHKPTFPWGADAPSERTAHLEQSATRAVAVTARAAGDSPYGCRQMIGNAWEWTASTFRPYPGFEIDPYREYSEPWFETHRVLRGGSFASRGRMLRNTWRNFALPNRRDLWTGFRTCALGE